MFGLFSRQKPVDEMHRAEMAYEKVASLKGDSPDARSLRLRMGLICRAHLDATFIAGAQQTVDLIEVIRARATKGQGGVHHPKLGPRRPK